MASHQLKEKEVLRQYYSRLCSTLLDIHTLLPYFVTENIINPENLEEINATTTSSQKVQKLLKCILGPLDGGHTRGFYLMLRIMEMHGTLATQDLANEIKSSFPGIFTDPFDSGM